MNRLCIDGARHSDPEIRRACILMMPRLFTESEMRIQALELLRQETRPELISLLEELSNKHGLTVETIELTPNSQFIPKIGNNREFLKVGLKLNNSEKFGLSISGEKSHLIQFKKREIQDKNVVHLKEKIRSELLQILQQAVFSKELKRLRDSAEIEIKNTMFLNQESS